MRFGLVGMPLTARTARLARHRPIGESVHPIGRDRPWSSAVASGSLDLRPALSRPQVDLSCRRFDAGVTDIATPVRSRIGGLDLARAVAMVGMVLVHYVLPFQRPSSSWDTLLSWPGGRAMPLFVLLGGIGATLLARGHRDRDLVVRAVVVIAIGLAMVTLPGPLVILTTYGALFLATPMLRRLRSRTLIALSVAVALVGSWTYQVGATVPAQIDVGVLERPAVAAWLLVVGGAYPLVPTAAFFFIGMAVGRLDLRSPSTALRLAAGGAVMAVVPHLLVRILGLSYSGFLAFSAVEPSVVVEPSQFELRQVLDPSPHSQMVGWVASSTGLALLVVGLALLVSARWPRATRPAEVVGRMALTFYVVHYVVPGLRPSMVTEASLRGQLLLTLAVCGGFALLAQLWARHLGTGPMERLLRLGSQRAAGPFGGPSATLPEPQPGNDRVSG